MISHYLYIKDVHISFPLHLVHTRSFRVQLLNALRFRGPKREYFAALSAINFKARPGDRVGIIGRNGSGKSTLLRVMSGAYEPVMGKYFRKGKLAALLDISLGMNHERTGRENVYLKGLHLGVSNKDIARILPEIIEFAELGPHMDLPLKTYSSGMQARLSFAIATSFSADIYLMDEWIGAGDARFMDRATERMDKLIHDKAILVLASHSDALIQKWCNKVLVLDRGEQILLTDDVEYGLKVKNDILRGKP